MKLLNMETSFTVKTPVFEGPLELLLSLIEKRKLFVNDISLAAVTDDYIEHVKKLEQFPIGDTANFILIASTLLLIKSKSLLPTIDLTDEETESIEELEYRLKLLKKFKEASAVVNEHYGKAVLFQKSQRKIEPVFCPEPALTLGALLGHMMSVLKSLPKKELLPKTVIAKVVSLEEMIDRLTERIKTGLRIGFRDFAGVGKEVKVNVIVSFLAVLELVKQGVINVAQENHFEDIELSTEKLDVPRYN
ncbi:MAG: ScpA family protein [bacterium]|nr:ScpA family protein [bacterium]